MINYIKVLEPKLSKRKPEQDLEEINKDNLRKRKKLI